METNQKQGRTKHDQVYGVKDFYESYDRKYDPALLGLKGKRHKKITFEQYKQIIAEYWDIRFKEIYFMPGSSYFLFTGLIQKVLYGSRIIKTHNKIKPLSPTIGFMWYMRPSGLFHTFCALNKLTGKTNRIPKIELLFKKNNDINLIPNFDQTVVQYGQDKNLYIE